MSRLQLERQLMASSRVSRNHHLASPRLMAPADIGEFLQFADDEHITDGLPVVPPTEATVDAMLGGTTLAPNTKIGIVPPLEGMATVEKVAINAVMAGCLPDYLPVVIAGLRAVLEPEFNLFGVQATTNPVAPLFIVNGPIRASIGMNTSYGAFGPGNRANATVGRAIRLTLMNVGGAFPGIGDMSGLGWVGKYTLCLPENEEDSPWEPLSVSRGMAPGFSGVTAVAVSGSINVRGANRHGRRPPAEIVLHELAEALSFTGSNDYAFGGQPVIVLNPQHADLLAKSGYSKQAVQRAIFDLASLPAEEFAVPEFTEYRDDIPDDHTARVPPATAPEDIIVVAAGARAAGDHSQALPSFGQFRAVTKPVEE